MYQCQYKYQKIDVDIYIRRGSVVSKINKLFDEERKKQNKKKNSEITAAKTPKDVNQIFSEVTSMLGVLSLDIFDWSGNMLYSYYRWGKADNIFEEDELFAIVKYVSKRLKKIGQKKLQHLIIKSEDMNILAYSTEKIISIIHCEAQVKLALLTIHTKRATKKLSEMLLD